MSLHEWPNLLNGHDIRVDLIGECSADVEWFPLLLGTAAAFTMKDGWTAAPGTVFPEMVRHC